MRVVALCLTLLVCAGHLFAQTEDPFGAAVKRSLDRSRALYPQVTQPGSPLSQAFLRRVEWLNKNNRAYFADPDWPMKVTSWEAVALGIRAVRPNKPPTKDATTDQVQYLAQVTSNFATTGASFRKGQQILLETLQDNGRRGITMVDGRPILIWLDHVKVVRQITPGESLPVMVKVISAQYGYPGKQGYNVGGMIQSLISPTPLGGYELLVSDALLSPSAARQQNARMPTTMDATGRPVPTDTAKILTITYSLGGITKTKQELEGSMILLD